MSKKDNSDNKKQPSILDETYSNRKTDDYVKGYNIYKMDDENSNSNLEEESKNYN